LQLNAKALERTGFGRRRGFPTPRRESISAVLGGETSTRWGKKKKSFARPQKKESGDT